MKNKIYLIGDSFTDNLYKEQLFQKRIVQVTRIKFSQKNFTSLIKVKEK
jgi:hypothetical protein